MAAVIVRDATPADVPAMTALRAAIVRDPLITFTTHVMSEAEVAGELAALTSDGRAYLVAQTGRGVAGYAFYKQFRGGPGYRFAMEHTIHLDPADRGRGAGRRLMQALEQRAAAAGVRVLVAGISGGNRAGYDFHAACGFAEVGRMPGVGFKHGQWYELILMQKALVSQTVPGPG